LIFDNAIDKDEFKKNSDLLAIALDWLYDDQY